MARIPKKKRRLAREARETAKQLSIARESKKKANVKAERTIMAATHDLRFHGLLIIDCRETATLMALEISRDEEQRAAYFVDGAVYMPNRDVPGNRSTGIKLAAAIVYRT